MNADNEKFEKAIEHFKHELSGLRTGRASAALVENIIVESYGSKMPISHIASINIPDAKTVAIQPWDKANIGPIDKAIQAANIGINPVNDGQLIRLSIPPMTEERRREMVKVIGQYTEQARVAGRNAREEILKQLKRKLENTEITEDDINAAKEDLQKLVDGYNDRIKELSAAKEQEIMTI